MAAVGSGPVTHLWWAEVLPWLLEKGRAGLARAGLYTDSRGEEEETPGVHRPRLDPGSPLTSWTS